MKVFVTGGNGFIGSHVVRLLLEAGHETKCLVRETSDTSRLEGLDWERYQGDVRDADSILKGAKGCDAIIHLASPSSWNDIDSPHMAAIVEEGTRNVLEAARACGNIRVVYCSSIIAVNGTETPTTVDESATFSLTDPKMVYAMSKNEAEKICDMYFEKYQLPIVTVNPCEVYGPQDTGFVTAGSLVDFAQSYPVLVSHGGTSITHVEDVAQGIVLALEKGRAGERYILGGENLTIRELAEKTLEILEKKAPIMSIPNSMLKALTSVGVALHLPLPYNPLVIPYATLYWFVDNKKAVEELGVNFRPADEVLRPTLDWLREEGHIN